jgi:hypothetical protein
VTRSQEVVVEEKKLEKCQKAKAKKQKRPALLVTRSQEEVVEEEVAPF